MSSPLSPLLFDQKKGEYYLALPPPLAHIRITPPRLGDVDAHVEILNEDGVWPYLSSPPYPYLKQHSQEWIERIDSESTNLIDALEKQQRDTTAATGATKFVGGCPVRCLREVKVNPDGSEEELLIGDLAFSRHGYPEIMDPDESRELAIQNMNREVGDPEIVWMVGYLLRTSHHGKGIMSAALKLLLKDWVIPHMGGKKMIGTVFDGNVGSTRVMEKCGFVVRPEKLVNHIEIPQSKGGGRKTLVVLDWHPEALS